MEKQKMRKPIFVLIILISFLLLSFFIFVLYSVNETNNLVGWRSSEYGYQQEQPPSYWVNVANEMSSKFPNSEPSGIWILGTKQDNEFCYLQFPNPGGTYDYINFSSQDENEEYLDAFDAAEIKVWLQVEPGNADVETLIDLVFNQYKHHSSVIGFGVDVEWLENTRSRNGRAVTNAEAQAWLNKIKSYDSNYKLFLKHWETNKMPTSYPEDIVFISDNQEFSSHNDMISSFEDWGNHFSDAEVGFQYGYESDRWIWESLDDPPRDIGNDLIKNIPNCRGLYWVDFTIADVFTS